MTFSRKAKRTGFVILAACLLAAMCALVACSSPQASSSSKSSQVMQVSSEAQPSSSVAATGVHNVLLTGNDKWDPSIPGHPDMLCILRVDLDNRTITEITVPRDTRYELPDGKATKLNDYMTEKSHEEQVKCVEQASGMKIDNYIEIGFPGLEKLVDANGGVPMNLPYDVSYHFYTEDYPDDSFTAGEQVLNGFRAMEISRARTGYGDQDIDDQDMVRQYVCREMLTSLIQLAYNGGVDSATSSIKNYQDAIETDIPLETQIAWAEKLGSQGSFKVVGTTGPFRGDIDPDTELWLVTPDPDGWAALKDAVENGGDIQVALDTYQYSVFPEPTPGVVETTIKVGK